jgi:hypothetical protein
VNAATAALALATPVTDTDRLTKLRALLRPEFLTEAGWDAETQVLAPPRAHPLLGLRKCAVIDCQAGVRTPNTDLCKLCAERFKVSGIPIESFTATPCGKIVKGEQWCRIPGCQRPSHLRVRLCHNHYCQWRKANLPVGKFAAMPHVRPFGSLGPCRVASCTRSAASGQGLCQSHRARWKADRGQVNGLAFAGWLRLAEPINADHLVIFKGLTEQAQLELLVGLQQRTAAGVRTLLAALRPVVTALRQSEANSLEDLDEALIKQTRHDAALLARTLTTTVRRCLASPETERGKGRLGPDGVRADRKPRFQRHQPAVAARDQQAVGRRRPTQAPRPASGIDGEENDQRDRRTVDQPAAGPR